MINGGDYTHKILSPKEKVEEIYDAVLDLPIDSQDILAFSAGVKMKDLEALPAKSSVLLPELADKKTTPLQCQVCACIHERKFHRAKRMFMARRKTVLALRHVQIGSLKLDSNLSPGETRRMTVREVLAILI